MRTRLLLIRHGESTWNAERRWQGQADPPLSKAGEQQATHAARVLHQHSPFDVVVSSSLRRARHTGELLARGASIALGEQLAELSERAAGTWEGLTREEIDMRYPGFLAAGREPEGFESDASIVERALPAIVALAELHRGRTVLVVSHGGVINALERHARHDESEPFRRIDNLEGRWFDHSASVLTTTGERVSLLDGEARSTQARPSDEQYA